MTDNFNGQEKMEALLPPVELIQRYEELGMGQDLINLVEKEQKHRHKLQKKYLKCYKLGQFLGFLITGFISYGIYNLFIRDLKLEAYIITSVFVLTIIYIFSYIRKDRETTVKKRQVSFLRKNNTTAQRFSNNNRRSFYKK